MTQALEPPRELVQLLALGRVDDADPFEREVESRGGFPDARPFAEQDRHAQPQGMELAGGLEHARFRAFRKDNPLRMPL